MYSRTKKILLIIASLVGVCILVYLGRLVILNCDHNSGTFVVNEDHRCGEGRWLQLNCLDSCFMAKRRPNVSHIPMPSTQNMEYQGKVENWEIYDSIDGQWMKYPVFVHRFTGRVDTFYTAPNGAVLGYVKRSYYGKKWLVIETMEPCIVLKHSFLAREEYKKRPIEHLNLGCYTFEGQRKFFDSESSEYWVASRQTTDLYGPLTEAELRIQLTKLDVSLPIILEGEYDRYVYNNTEEFDSKDGHFVKEKIPKEFNYFHWKRRPDKIIQPQK